MRILNDICMNMQVTMLSDICNARGDKIEEWAWKCCKQFSKKQWQKSIIMSPRLKEIWVEALGETVVHLGSKRLKKNIR